MKSVLELLLVVVASLIVGLMAWVLMLAMMPVSYYSCMDKLDTMQVEGVWRFWTGCYVNQGGMLIPFDKWIVVIQP